MQTYLVGGAVRDRLLGVPVYDQDWVVVGATPQQMLAQGFLPVGKDFPVFLHPTTKEEYALARTERKQGVGYHGFSVWADVNITLEQDLLRRDLTINAMAKAEDGTLIDPYGGQQDLQNRVLRHVSPAFNEDPLRVLRVARFAAKLAPFGFHLAEETQVLMQQMSAGGELQALTPERVWQEVVKAMACAQPRRFFEVLDAVGALPVLFAELHALKGVAQPVKYHPEGDAWIHTLMVLEAACELSQHLAVRFAALVHDLGKSLTPPELWPKHHGHEAAGVPLVAALCARYRVPKKVEQLARKVTEYHGLIHSGLREGQPALQAKTYHKVFHECGAYRDPVEFSELLIVCQADARGRLGFERCDYPQLPFWSALLQAASAVDNQVIIAKGYQGVEFAEQVRLQRIANIHAFLTQYRTVTNEASGEA
ncbi:MAG: multifunctional CCA addition/repair protein [Thiotrichales bacterium]|nr:multifunctional CCA addition/repair protein [Thiotrichales bacterium]